MSNSNDLAELLTTSHLGAGASNYLEGMYESYQDDPQAIPKVWRDYFSSLTKSYGNNIDLEYNHSQVRQELINQVKQKSRGEVIENNFV